MRSYVDRATNSKATLNANTFTKILDTNSGMRHIIISNPSEIEVYVNLCSVDTGVDDTGIYIPGGEKWPMPCGTVYTGEICAIAVSGTPTICFTWY